MITKREILKNLSNLPGWRTNRKIVVIESDDWGSIRMPSKKVYNDLEKQGFDLSKGSGARYNRYDSLATSSDLLALFETLSQVKDKNNKSALITAVSVTANPDFEKIKDSGFRNYYYEPFVDTLSKTSGCENSFELWKEGISNRLFIPEFHGREHLNVDVWMRALRSLDKLTLAAFEQGFWGFSNKHYLDISFQAAFELEYFDDLENHKAVVASGLRLFEQLMGYKATFFVPPNGPFNNELETVAAREGVRFMSASKVQFESIGEGKTNRRYHWLGKKNECGQYYIVRNCVFEPSQAGIDWVDSCMKDIEIAFKWFKPAIIGSHRVNFIGAIDENNRVNGLSQLKKLLNLIVKKWPDVEFMSSSDLGYLIAE